MRRVFSEAHGRVNLIGEHTDYNGGFVFPTAIPQKTSVELIPHTHRKVTVFSANMSPSLNGFSYELGAEQKSNSWADFVQGLTAMLQKRGFNIGGFEAKISSTVPIGSGLSSSAALEISLLRALKEAFSLDLDIIAMAQIAQQTENDFVGARVGIMDQMAAGLATFGEGLFIDTRSLDYIRVPLPLGAMDLLVINSGLSHSHSTNEYNQRRAQCDEACKILGISQLRDLPLNDLPSALKKLPEILAKRTRHVVTENERVLETLSALKNGDLLTMGKLLNASHASLRDDYAVSIPEIDYLVEQAQEDTEVYGARITGGGFGGSIVVLTQYGAARRVGERLLVRYQAHYSDLPPPTILVPEAMHTRVEIEVSS